MVLIVAGAGVERTGDEMPGDSENGGDSGGSSESSSDSSSESDSRRATSKELTSLSESSDDENFISTITGGVIGAGKNLLSGTQLVLVIGMFVGLFVVLIISRTILELKKK